MLTPYQFASNSPIAAIDLDGLESKISVKADPDDAKSFLTISNGLAAVTEEAIRSLENAEMLKTSVSRLKGAAAIGGIVVDYNSTNFDDPKAKSDFEKRLSATAIGEIVSIFNPVVGFAAAFVIRESIGENGLIILSNGRMSEAFEQSLSSSKGHYRQSLVLSVKPGPVSEPVKQYQKVTKNDMSHMFQCWWDPTKKNNVFMKAMNYFLS